MKYLDLASLNECKDPELCRFLIEVNQRGTKRRAISAFPEFFSDDSGDVPAIDWPVLVQRHQTIVEADDTDETGEADSNITQTFEWFGLNIEKFESRTDGVPDKHQHYQLLPHDFLPEHIGDYDGMSSLNPWIVSLPVTGSVQSVKYLIVQIKYVGEENLKYFLWAVPVHRIIFDE